MMQHFIIPAHPWLKTHKHHLRRRRALGPPDWLMQQESSSVVRREEKKHLYFSEIRQKSRHNPAETPGDKNSPAHGRRQAHETRRLESQLTDGKVDLKVVRSAEQRR